MCSVLQIVILISLCSVIEALPSIVVLTKNRLRSLLRLLDSIATSEPRDEPIDLHICCDTSDRADRDVEEVRTYVQQLQWTRGYYSFDIALRPRRLTTQWLTCTPSNETVSTRFVMLEDDIEIAPYALKWLDDAYNAYALDDNVAGFSLQRQTNCFHNTCAQRVLSIPWTVREYKYALVGTWGFAPVARHWRAFREWYWKLQSAPEPYTPYVEGLIPSDWYSKFKKTGREHSMWSMWYIDYCNRNRLFTVYYRHPTPLTLAAHWGERGEHFDGKNPKQDYALVSYDVLPIDRAPQKELWWNGRGLEHQTEYEQIATIVATVKQQFVDTGQTPLVTFISSGFYEMTRHFLCNLRAVAPELIESIVFVVADPQAYDDMLAMRSTDHFSVKHLVIPSLGDATLMFGTRAYFNMLLVRTRLIAAIATARVPFFLFECDAAVRENFVQSFSDAARSDNVDLVGIQDDLRDKGVQPNAGFLLMTNRSAVAPFWQRIASRFEREFAAIPLNDTKRMFTVLNDQLIMRTLLSEKKPIAKIHLMDPVRYRSGQTLDDVREAEAIRNSNVVLFNFVIGNAVKRRRAMKHAMWYYDEARRACRIE